MTSRQINLGLSATAATLAVGAIVCASLVALAPLRHARNDGTSSASAPTTQPTSLPPLEALQQAASVPLRRTTEVATTQEASPVVASSSDAPPVTLVGTIGTSLALLRTPAGQVELKAVGEEAMGAKVLAIRPAQVDVRFNGQSVTLHKPKEPATPG